ncbi:MAG: ATP-dependent protease [Nitrospirae bacterium GWF2_44_13]|nr:MAG: ATP-dependent protease [Nitrospirae bacterium GWF2_44_13]OGW35239.1 MAG: ATP-dependent protease [Nitrospirae bacterium GWD2_44_7]OGW64318.1 MAG: ATP-dependent protease [Nitrospirae bacterium RIFOXYA2_FULL_44_9]HBG93338.1 ATP-dependent protease [Nitrospiraceae bacterium]
MPEKLSVDELYKCCNQDLFKFKTTDELPLFEETIGQERALRALDFGIGFNNRGFNIFILGESGTGKMTTIRSILSKQAINEPVPSDWCYVYNFKDADAPIAVPLEPGMAVIFQKDMDELINVLRVEIPKVFESKEYEKQRNLILEEFQKKQKDLFSQLEDEAQAKGFSIRKTVSGLLIVPVKKTGEPLKEDEFEALDEKIRKKAEELGKMLQDKLDDVVRTLRDGEKLVKDLLAMLEREAALSAVGHLIDELKNKYSNHERITAYFEGVKEDILAHLDDFKTAEEQTPALPFMRMPKTEPTFTRYIVNVLVNNKETKGAPCVFESNPTYFDLFGRIEHKIQYGIALTDFSMIKAGSLHRANGGYIVINVLDLLKNIFAYDALKRALRNKEVKIEDVWEQYRLISTTTLKPEAIPLNVKIILVGNPYLYYLLYSLDEEYRELFKVKADFDSRMDRTDENIQKYASFVAAKCKDENLIPFDRTGIAKVVEYGSRLAEHQEKLSSKFSEINDVIVESNYWALKAKSKTVTNEHVEKAINEKVYRNNRIEERMREMIAEGTLIVDTSGEKAGQVNGLAVLDLGDYSFGKPSRITAATYTGKAGVVNIERETKMSGKIHEKAILIITNYLGSRYASKKPISLSASITFEQLYDMVEGDSASCAELYALLSSIANVPLKQGIAVTGSMDQNGDVQPIGGVNEKIEGFFELCRLRGLDGSHGVIIPRRNVKHLMIKKDVVDAVKAGKFTIYPINRVEDGLEILTGLPAGELREDGTYPEGTINYLVAKRFEEIREALKGKKEKDDDEEKEKGKKENNA